MGVFWGWGSGCEEGVEGGWLRVREGVVFDFRSDDVTLSWISLCCMISDLYCQCSGARLSVLVPLLTYKRERNHTED